MKRREKGQRGEAIAAVALEHAGYTILVRNWRSTVRDAGGELDIIAQHNNEIVFVEVRARWDGIDAALESITPAKQTRLMRLAQAYLAENGLEQAAFRIDVVAIALNTTGLSNGTPTVEIIQNAVSW